MVSRKKVPEDEWMFPVVMNLQRMNKNIFQHGLIHYTVTASSAVNTSKEG